jgi:prepilin-type N-terminal cleavage/methylation domain-containing protein
MINFLKNLNKFPNKKSGFSLVEVMVACLIISLTTIALMSATANGIKLSDTALRQVQASSLMEEGVEAVKSIRDTSWATISTLSLDTTYYLSFDINTNTWSLGTDPTAVIDEMFTRTVIISAVSRDENDDIASSGTVDEGTKKVDVSVSWLYAGETNSKNISFYLADIFN